MSKMSELAAQLFELKRCGEILIGISDTLTELFSGDAMEKENRTENPTEKESVKPTTKSAEPEQETKALTLEEVRAVLAEKSRAGHTAQVRELLEKHGASKLSKIDPAEYPALLAEAEAL